MPTVKLQSGFTKIEPGVIIHVEGANTQAEEWTAIAKFLRDNNKSDTVTFNPNSSGSTYQLIRKL